MLFRSILDMSKMETGKFEITPEPFVPGQIIASCCDLLALKARDAGVELKRRIAFDLPEVVADCRAFNQILINLISNAIKFTPRGGRVTVSALCDGPNFFVTVEDTGVGIGENDLPRLGEAFFQARASYDRRHDGSGLGLSIVKGLVQLHGGAIDIRSRLGEGTRLWVGVVDRDEHGIRARRRLGVRGDRGDSRVGVSRPAVPLSIRNPQVAPLSDRRRRWRSDTRLRRDWQEDAERLRCEQRASWSRSPHGMLRLHVDICGLPAAKQYS